MPVQMSLLDAPRIDGEAPEALEFRLSGKAEGINRVLRRGQTVLLLVSGHVKTVAQTERAADEDMLVVRVATVAADSVRVVDHLVAGAAGTSETELIAAARAGAARDYDVLIGQEPLPLDAYLNQAES